MARLFGDEDFSRPVMAELAALGHDVDGVLERGLGGIRYPDPSVLATATADGRAVLTFNRWDFNRLHHRGATHAGIIACTRDADHPALAARIHAALPAAGGLTGQLVQVPKS